MDTVTPSPKTPLRDRLSAARAQASCLRRQARQTLNQNGGRHRLTLLLAYAIAMVVAIGFYVVASGVYTLACLWIDPETVSPILLSKLADLLFALLCLFFLLFFALLQLLQVISKADIRWIKGLIKAK